MTRGIWLGMAAALAVLMGSAPSAVAAEINGGTLEQWIRHREATRTDPTLGRYYTFEKVKGDTVANLVADGADPLVFRMEASGAKGDKLQLVPGRWPGKQAVRLDSGCLIAKAPDVPGRAFSAVMWVCKHGQGTQRGNSGTTNGMLLAVDNGYWDGWRLFTSYPSQTIAFEIGRPQPSSAIGTSTGIVSDEVWHQLAATWDGQRMSVYVDGELATSRAFDGVYTPPAGNDLLRIGFADSGVGSALMDVDELAIYRKALTPEQIVADLYFYAELSKQQLELWSAASRATAKNDPESAERALAQLSEMRGLNPDVRAATQMQLAEVRLRLGHSSLTDATREIAAIADDTHLPSRLSRQATAKLVEMIKAGAVVPAPMYARAMALPGLGEQDRLSIELGLGNAIAGNGDLAGAQKQYLKLAEDMHLPVQWRALALCSLARAQTVAKDYSSAKVTYDRVKQLPGMPRYWASLLEQRLAELRRLEAGKPMDDPLAGRTQLPPKPTPAVTLYVSPNGKGGNLGTAQQPLATLEQARDVIRQLKADGKVPAGGVQVVVSGGRYDVRTTFQLTSQDSGTEKAPVTYVAAPGEVPVFDGGMKIGGFEPIQDPKILSRLPAEVRGKVYQTDLKKQGVPIGSFELGGFASARKFITHPVLELFCDGKAMPLARWPNDGYVHVGEIPAGTKGAFTYTGEHLDRWQKETDGWLYGYWFYDWADGYEKIASVDVVNKRISLAPPFSTYGESGAGFKAGQRFYATNMLCEVDSPGEWYLDRDSAILYFYPPSDPSRANVEVSVFANAMVNMQDVSHVSLAGLTFSNGRGDAIAMSNCSDCLVAGCTIRQFGGVALQVSGARNGVLSCDMHCLGRGGIAMESGDRKSLTAGGSFVENCHIYDFSRIDHTYTPAVLMNGDGNRISHNLFHDANSSAIRIEGNDHAIEYNDVHHVLKDSDDQGATDIWGNPTFRGLLFRYNYWHDMGNGLDCGQAGIRLDDFISGVVIYGNIFQRCSDGGFGGVQMNGGSENYIDNNVFLQCKAAISGGSGDENRWRTFLAGSQGKGYIDEVHPMQPPYSVRYPELQQLGRNLTNYVWRNLVLDCRSFVLSEQRLNLMDNCVSAHAGTVTGSNGVPSFPADSPIANRLSFDPIPSAQIGLYVDAYRKQ